MALDFPNSPTNGQIFNGWQWNGTAWIALGIAGGASVSVGDTAPANPKVGDLWWDSVSGQLFVWFQDANSSQWVVSVSNPGAVGPVGPAGPPGPNVLPPGVTDGSNAAAGQIGEYIIVNFVGATGLSEIMTQTLVIGPGDWDIGFACYVAQTYGPPVNPFWSSYQAQCTPAPIPSGWSNIFFTDIAILAPTNMPSGGTTWPSAECRLARGGVRANVTASTTFTMSITANWTLAGGAPAATTRATQGYMWARRMR